MKTAFLTGIFSSLVRWSETTLSNHVLVTFRSDEVSLWACVDFVSRGTARLLVFKGSPTILQQHLHPDKILSTRSDDQRESNDASMSSQLVDNGHNLMLDMFPLPWSWSWQPQWLFQIGSLATHEKQIHVYLDKIKQYNLLKKEIRVASKPKQKLSDRRQTTTSKVRPHKKK